LSDEKLFSHFGHLKLMGQPSTTVQSPEFFTQRRWKVDHWNDEPSTRLPHFQTFQSTRLIAALGLLPTISFS
jgi:hypothetical protein